MNKTRIDYYNILNRLSKDVEDVLSSEDYHELLADCGKTSHAENLEATVQIKIGRESFRDAYHYYSDLRDKGLDIKTAQQRLTRHFLDQKLGFLSSEEKRCVLLEGISRLNVLLGTPITESDSLQQSQMSSEELTAILSKGIQELSDRSIKNALDMGALDSDELYTEVHDLENSKNWDTQADFHSDAWAGAGYVAEPEWKDKTGLLGMIGGMIGEAINDAAENVFSETGGFWNRKASDIIGDILVVASTICAATFILCIEFETLCIPFYPLLTLGDLTMKEIMLDSLVLFKDFAFGTIVAIGVGAVGILCKAGDKLIDLIMNKQEASITNETQSEIEKNQIADSEQSEGNNLHEEETDEDSASKSMDDEETEDEEDDDIW